MSEARAIPQHGQEFWCLSWLFLTYNENVSSSRTSGFQRAHISNFQNCSRNPLITVICVCVSISNISTTITINPLKLAYASNEQPSSKTFAHCSRGIQLHSEENARHSAHASYATGGHREETSNWGSLSGISWRQLQNSGKKPFPLVLSTPICVSNWYEQRSKLQCHVLMFLTIEKKQNDQWRTKTSPFHIGLRQLCKKVMWATLCNCASMQNLTGWDCRTEFLKQEKKPHESFESLILAEILHPSSSQVSTFVLHKFP